MMDIFTPVSDEEAEARDKEAYDAYCKNASHTLLSFSEWLAYRTPLSIIDELSRSMRQRMDEVILEALMQEQKESLTAAQVQYGQSFLLKALPARKGQSLLS